MKKDFAKKITVLAVGLMFLTGCGQTKTIPTLEDGSQAIASFEDGTMISINDLYKSLKDSYGLSAVLNIIDKTILEKEYKDDLTAASESANSTMSQLESSYGDELLQAIQYYTDYNTLDEYKDSLYLSYLQNKAIEDYAKSKITESQIKKYYKSDIKSDIKVSHILLGVTVADDASDDDKTKANEEAKAKAQEVLDILKNTKKEEISTKFAELAKQYSTDDATKEDGGNLGFINTDTLGDDYSKLVDAAYELKDGEYSTSIIESTLGYHLVLRVETKEKASLEDVRDNIVDALVEKYITDNADATIKGMQELRKKYGLTIVDSELNTSYTNYIQSSLLQAQESNNQSSN